MASGSAPRDLGFAHWRSPAATDAAGAAASADDADHTVAESSDHG